MRRFLVAPLFALGLIAANLTGCASATDITTLASTSVGQALLNAMINTLVPGINTAIANAENNATTRTDLASVAFALP